MIVMKFGGTSVKDAKSMQEVLKIVKSSEGKKIVLLSACSGMTDKLVCLITDAANRAAEFPNKTIDEVEDYHINLCCELYRNELFRNYSSVLIKRYCNELRKLADGVHRLKECSPRSLDRAASFGELLSTTIFHFLCLENSLKPILIDARKVIKTNSNFTSAKVLMKETKKNALKIIGTELGISSQKEKFNFTKLNYKNGNYVQKSEDLQQTTTDGIEGNIDKSTNLVITQGFIASDLFNKTTTLGRGGSDWSAAILGSCLNADEIQIYTDVDGILTSDPRIIKNSKLIEKISFDEVKELSFFGAKVVHPDTIFPALSKNIPVRILNTFNTNVKGTLIYSESKKSQSDFKSIVLKKECMYCYLKFNSKTNIHFYSNKFLNFFKRRGIKIYFQSSSISRITFLIEKNSDIKFFSEQLPGNILIELADVNLIVLCGNDILNSDKEKYNIVFNELLKVNDNCLFIGFTKNSLIAAVLPDYSEEIAKKIHNELFENC
ncbi:MAG TPA: hypothetical protein PK762_07055 [Candidatus Kapabacteria bacterium]|nr:hypothetical protein [Candidatus Kapabacteria bacterium]